MIKYNHKICNLNNYKIHYRNIKYNWNMNKHKIKH